MTHAGSIVVLQTLRPPDGTTKYVDQVVEGVPDEVEMRFFSWPKALLGRYDVLHVHWPELLVRHRTGWQRFLKRRALGVLPFVLRLRHVPIVWTMHNRQPHEVWSRAEERSIERFSRHVTLVIRLSDAIDVEVGRDAVTIPHGHYRERFAGLPLPEPVPGRVLYFGIIRPYKGVRELTAAFSDVQGDDVTLRIVGDPHAGQRAMVEEATLRDPRISASLRFVPDAELVAEVGRAQLVVLPYLEPMGNSGSLLMALSLGRPVLVPRSATNQALADEVGDEWVIQYDGPITADAIRAGLRAAAAVPAVRPRLERRDWSTVGFAHQRAYYRAIDLAHER